MLQLQEGNFISVVNEDSMFLGFSKDSSLIQNMFTVSFDVLLYIDTFDHVPYFYQLNDR